MRPRMLPENIEPLRLIKRSQLASGAIQWVLDTTCIDNPNADIVLLEFTGTHTILHHNDEQYDASCRLALTSHTYKRIYYSPPPKHPK